MHRKRSPKLCTPDGWRDAGSCADLASVIDPCKDRRRGCGIDRKKLQESQEGCSSWRKGQRIRMSRSPPILQHATGNSLARMNSMEPTPKSPHARPESSGRTRNGEIRLGWKAAAERQSRPNVSGRALNDDYTLNCRRGARSSHKDGKPPRDHVKLLSRAKALRGVVEGVPPPRSTSHEDSGKMDSTAVVATRENGKMHVHLDLTGIRVTPQQAEERKDAQEQRSAAHCLFEAGSSARIHHRGACGFSCSQPQRASQARMLANNDDLRKSCHSQGQTPQVAGNDECHPAYLVSSV